MNASPFRRLACSSALGGAATLALVMAAAATVSCSQPASSADDVQADAADGGDDGGPPADETERERLSRLAREKREQCGALIDAVQATEEMGLQIVNLNDDARLRAVAAEIETSVAPIRKVSIQIEALAALRDGYVDRHVEMAGALRNTADAPNDAVRKQELARYKESDAATTKAVDDINAFCSE